MFLAVSYTSETKNECAGLTSRARDLSGLHSISESPTLRVQSRKPGSHAGPSASADKLEKTIVDAYSHNILL